MGCLLFPHLISFNLADDSIILSIMNILVGLFQLEAKFAITYGNSGRLTSLTYLILPTARVPHETGSVNGKS